MANPNYLAAHGQLHMADHNYFSGGDSGDSDADGELDDLDEDELLVLQQHQHHLHHQPPHHQQHQHGNNSHNSSGRSGGGGGGRKRKHDDADDVRGSPSSLSSGWSSQWGPTSSWSCNERRVFRHTHQWTVDDFVARMSAAKPGEKLKSKVRWSDVHTLMLKKHLF